MLYADAAARDISSAGQSCSDPGCCRHRAAAAAAVIAANIIISIVVAFAYVTGCVFFCFHIGCFTAPASAFFVFFFNSCSRGVGNSSGLLLRISTHLELRPER